MNLFLRDLDPQKLIKMASMKSASFWQSLGEKRSLLLFHEAARRVPAYKDFLRKNGVRAGSIKSYADFTKLPPVDKDSYLRKYPLEDLVWDGTMKDKSLVFTATSGSTGKPFYFPRDEALDIQSSVFHELFLKNSLRGKKRSTLVIDCFGMGVWIGGLITYQAFKKIGLRGYPVSVITPGSNKREIFEAMRNIAGGFDQVVLCGYPPFIKDVLDEGILEGIDWKKYTMKLLFAAEAFSDSFRSYVAGKAGITSQEFDITNIYGTADLGTMAMETPLSIAIRKSASADEGVFTSLFGEVTKLPTLAQFNPLFANFESVDGVLYVTGYNTVPLVRYRLGDRGGVFEFPDMLERFGRNRSLKKVRDSSPAFPFVYVYEREDLSTKLCGAILYPEHVREALLEPSIADRITGKFTMETKIDKDENQYLEIHIELKTGVRNEASLEDEVRRIVKKHMLEKNAEYAYLHSMIAERVNPVLVFWDHGSESYFKTGCKQKWVIKN